MRTVTSFDTAKHHIHVDFIVTDRSGTPFDFSGVIDTGAPWTEFSDEFLIHAGFIAPPDEAVALKPELQTQKYGRVVLPSLTVCGQVIHDLRVMVSRFDESWGIAALIGLDFFRRFRVTVDYARGELICEPL
jgi:hypothetical protein